LRDATLGRKQPNQGNFDSNSADRRSEATIHYERATSRPKRFSLDAGAWFASLRSKQHSPNKIGGRLSANGRRDPIDRLGTVDSPGKYAVLQADCFEWMNSRKVESIHAIVTDPPYGLKEYTEGEKSKLRSGRGGVWRIPPSFDGCERSPLPRFTVLSAQEISALRQFFREFAQCAFRIMVPGAHLFIATNPLLSHLVYLPLMEVGFEKRGEVIRLVQTLRGGDRPKNAHQEFSDISVMPRSAWEPWGLFRKPCEGRVQDNLRKWKTGGLRRISATEPFLDVIRSAPTRPEERALAPHPSLKPQTFMRQIVRASLPLGKGIVLDPFMGGGSTIAAATAVGYESIGIEADREFFRIAMKAIPQLAQLTSNGASYSDAERQLPLAKGPGNSSHPAGR
jgi:DNA modification methylase